MNMRATPDLNAAIRLHQASDYIPEPDIGHYSGPVTLLVWGLIWIASAALLGGVAYALHQAWQALT
ncbi:MAG: hypothetical protein EOS10_00190 [Mesorhizobium sp.]|uniref:hypothetical protein n=1 Tax=Mesorhizobium sp. TaxID=1871066 RepID=UPI000FE5D17C|nr:hypothetical protein [Mesorhizobium sp.]RWO34758.1 MAG: hypothetical protein EOS10_00190 [Mesorhizobium sp.]